MRGLLWSLARLQSDHRSETPRLRLRQSLLARPRKKDKIFVTHDEAEKILRLTDLTKRSNEALDGMTEIFMSIGDSTRISIIHGLGD
ncbi:uncharacterized protein N7483_002080 [Penicillium malachiteum]|uniref:uncharacterized protein n=1 Tax=Penicillium malachiteum TaxID=1324776 RepID=UPI0025467E04|nr:uncharacterized protein N7483_002080 [Penicillium malachiteum]KAJ5736955.1 hypothetical protein N7483_002080 [Penicillium malachiteum]